MILFFWIIMAIIVAMIAASKKQSAVLWFFYGLLIWPIALVHILLLREQVRIAPRFTSGSTFMDDPPPRGWDGESILPEAKFCQYCGQPHPRPPLSRLVVHPGGKLREDIK